MPSPPFLQCHKPLRVQREPLSFDPRSTMNDMDHTMVSSSHFSRVNPNAAIQDTDDDEFPIGASVCCARGFYKNQKGTVTLSRGKLVRVDFDNIGKRCVLRTTVTLLSSSEDWPTVDGQVQQHTETRAKQKQAPWNSPSNAKSWRDEPASHFELDSVIFSPPKFDVDLEGNSNTDFDDAVDENQRPNNEEGTERCVKHFWQSKFKNVNPLRLTTESSADQNVDPIISCSPRVTDTEWVSFDIPFDKSAASFWTKPKDNIQAIVPFATRSNDNNRGLEKESDSFESLERVGTFGGGKNDRIQVVTLDRSAYRVINSHRNPASAAMVPSCRAQLEPLTSFGNDQFGQAKTLSRVAGKNANITAIIPKKSRPVHLEIMQPPKKELAPLQLRIGNRVCCASGMFNGWGGQVVGKDGKMLAVQLDGINRLRYFKQDAVIPLSTKAASSRKAEF